MDETLKMLGKVIPRDASPGRDAVHIAVAPVTASCFLEPGTIVGFHKTDYGDVGWSPEPIGIVDPFLKTVVRPGEKFWVFLFPGSITALRHVWTHPAFTHQPIPSHPDAGFRMTLEEKDLVAAIKADPEEDLHRGAYAAWLEENDRSEEAQRQRDWRRARDTIRRVREVLNYGDYQDGGGKFSFKDMLEGGRLMVSDDPAPWKFSLSAQNHFSEEDNAAAFIKAWCTYTCEELPHRLLKQWKDDPPSYACSC